MLKYFHFECVLSRFSDFNLTGTDLREIERVFH